MTLIFVSTAPHYNSSKEMGLNTTVSEIVDTARDQGSPLGLLWSPVAPMVEFAIETRVASELPYPSGMGRLLGCPCRFTFPTTLLCTGWFHGISLSFVLLFISRLKSRIEIVWAAGATILAHVPRNWHDESLWQNSRTQDNVPSVVWMSLGKDLRIYSIHGQFSPISK